MPDQPGKRKAEQASWEQYSEIIEELFITGGKTMEDIRKILSEEHGFDKRLVFDSHSSKHSTNACRAGLGSSNMQ